MNVAELKNSLATIENTVFKLPSGELVPKHFHVTEVAKQIKHFIDCGGTERKENKVTLQLWSSIDYHHRLKASKLTSIIELSENKLDIDSKTEVEVEYQGEESINTYKLDFDGTNFLLKGKQTDCLAKSNCGIPVEKVKKQLVDLATSSGTCCAPGSGCC